MNKATSERKETWEYLCALKPDLALLQEVNSMPNFIENKFDCLYKKAAKKNGQAQRFGTAILVKGKIINPIQLRSKWNWVNEEINRFTGNFVAADVVLENGFRAQTISVHSPAWRIELPAVDEIDKSEIKLKNNRDVWGTELVWAALKNAVPKNAFPWIVGGDFNSSTTFDLPKIRGNQEFIDRMNALGLVECLFNFKGVLTPTFKNPHNQKVIHQIDHLFASAFMISNVESCNVGDLQEVFDAKLSDHLPIIADFLL
jgi:endonuclease/exonuclease/phosphatase family metal-dependent hydrolase